MSPRLIIADGWGLRPELVAPLLPSTQRMVRNRIARDRLIAEEAERLNIRVIEVDGSHDAPAMAGVAAEHFSAFLP
ncbi:hypothetical protein [Actinoplanes sp. NPDC049681]|uniref:hypothetical protein n=1 Tax=Actinoplanes sp. NPDC049681 TaxID=3363905 RepID=UPI003790FFC3